MRVFVAVDVIDGHARERLASFQRGMDGAGKAVEPHNLHFTLQFLGEISKGAADAAADALQSVKFGAFDVQLRGAGTFGRPPRVVWAGTDPDGGRKLARLADAVGEALGGDRKPFKPHLTVLRVKRGRRVDVSGYADRAWGTQRVNAIKLKRSVLARTGPTYTDIAEVAAG